MSTLRSLSRACTKKNKLKSNRELQNCAGGTGRPYGGRKHEAGGDTEVTHTVPARPSHADSLQSSIHKRGYNSQPHTHAACITRAMCFMLLRHNAVYSTNRTQHGSYTHRYHCALCAAVANNPTCILSPAATNEFATCVCNIHRKQRGKSAAPQCGPLQTITRMGVSLQN